MMHARRTEEDEEAACHSHGYSTMMQITQEYLAIALPHGSSRLKHIGDTLVALLTADFPQLEPV